MKVLLAILNYQSEKEHREVIAANLLNCGSTYQWSIQVVVFDINIKGLSKALNVALKTCLDGNYDGICFMANDIIEPKNWLVERLLATKEYNDEAIIAIPVNERHIVDTDTNIIGNYYIPRKIIEAVGYFTDSFGVYGAIDLDYIQRTRAKGFRTLYLGGVEAKHLTINGDTKYGFSKKEQVDKTWDKHVQDVQQYCQGKGNLYNDEPEYIINMEQYFTYESGNRIRDNQNEL